MLAANFTGVGIQTGTIAQTEFQPAPLDPTWILEGNPAPRSLSLAQSADGMYGCGLWECAAGKFKFIYFCDETVQILEGEVTVQESGKEYTLRAGDVAYFPQGLTTYWTIPVYVKKCYSFRAIQSSPLRRIGSKMKGLLQSLVGRK